MNRKDRNKRLLHEILEQYAVTWFPSKLALNTFVEELSQKYDVYLKNQDNQFKDE